MILCFGQKLPERQQGVFFQTWNDIQCSYQTEKTPKHKNGTPAIFSLQITKTEYEPMGSLLNQIMQTIYQNDHKGVRNTYIVVLCKKNDPKRSKIDPNGQTGLTNEWIEISKFWSDFKQENTMNK